MITWKRRKPTLAMYIVIFQGSTIIEFEVGVTKLSNTPIENNILFVPPNRLLAVGNNPDLKFKDWIPTSYIRHIRSLSTSSFSS